MRTILSKFNTFIGAALVLALMATAVETAAVHASDQTKTFVVIGTSPVQGANVSVAREKAIANSLVTAVALMTGELLPVESIVQNFAQLNELLFEQTSKYIQDYKLLTEATANNSYRVVVEASVSGGKISKQLSDSGILKAQTTLPGVLVLIAEQNLRDPSPRYWWSQKAGDFQAVTDAALMDNLKAAGFTIIDQSGARTRPGVNWGAFDKADLSDQEAAQLGADLQADVVVLGSAAATTATNVMGSEMKSFTATLTARVIRTDSGAVMLNFTRTAVAAKEDETAGSLEALADVGNQTGQLLAEELTALWQKEAAKPSVVEVVIRGTGQLANYVKFRKALNSVPGVEGIRVKELKPNEATLLVEFKGSAKELASALMLQHYESFAINIFEVTQSNLKVELMPG